jgi:hypothetical protein
MGYTMEDEKDRTLPEDTLLLGQLVEVTEKLIEWKDKTTGEDKSATMLQWWIECIDDREDGLFKGRKVRAECDDRLTNHPRNRFRQYVEAFLGSELALGTEIDPQEDLVGLKCHFTVTHRAYTDKSGNEGIAEDVDEVISLADDSDVPF